jgi:uncharacterized protein YcbK (DUF882 family)/LysM repeat protein
MRRLALYLALSTLCLAGTSAARSERMDAPRIHTVYSGQTLGMIARRYNVSIPDLCAANGISRKARIKPKQELIIPAPGESKDEVRARTTAQARSGEEGDTRSSSDKSPSSRARSKTDERDKEPVTRRDRYARRPAKKGYITVSSFTASFRGYAVGRDGKVTPQARKGIAKVMASWRTGEHGGVPDRLIRLITTVSDHFGGRALRIVSGYRPYSRLQYTPHSRHNLGHAVDFSIPGVPNEAVRDFCLTLGSVGVGYYPNSTFVHLDVREARTYWVDYSGPGEAPRYAHAKGSTKSLVPVSHGASKLTGAAAEYPSPQPVDPSSFGTRAGEFPHRERSGSQRTQGESLQAAEIP